MQTQFKLVKCLENEETDKFIALMKKLSKFEVFRLRFTMNQTGQTLVHLCAINENLTALQALLTHFRQCYKALLI